MNDIEHLKKRKIHRHRDGKVHLTSYPPPPALGDPDDDAEISEAFGGSEERSASSESPEVLRERVIEALQSIYDPEIPLNIYDLGLIYDVAFDEHSNVEIEMTLTAPGCPVAGSLVREVAEKAGQVEGVRRSHVRLTWDPPWSQERMSDEALLELGLL